MLKAARDAVAWSKRRACSRTSTLSKHHCLECSNQLPNFNQVKLILDAHCFPAWGDLLDCSCMSSLEECQCYHGAVVEAIRVQEWNDFMNNCIQLFVLDLQKGLRTLLGGCALSSLFSTLPMRMAPSGRGIKSSQAVLPTLSSQDRTLLGLKAHASILTPSQNTSVLPASTTASASPLNKSTCHVIGFSKLH